MLAEVFDGADRSVNLVCCLLEKAIRIFLFIQRLIRTVCKEIIVNFGIVFKTDSLTISFFVGYFRLDQRCLVVFGGLSKFFLLQVRPEDVLNLG